MLSHIDPFKSALASILSALIGTLSKYIYISSAVVGYITVDAALQRLAWTVAIMAGCVAIVNGTRNWFRKPKKARNEKQAG